MLDNTNISSNWEHFHSRIANLGNKTPREIIKTKQSQVHAAACLYLDYCIEKKEDARKADFHSDVYFLLFNKVLYVLFQLENSHSLLIAYGPDIGQAAYQESSKVKKARAEMIPDVSARFMERIRLFRLSGMDVIITAELLCREIDALIAAVTKNQ